MNLDAYAFIHHTFNISNQQIRPPPLAPIQVSQPQTNLCGVWALIGGQSHTLTSHLLLQVENNVYGLVKDEQFGLRFLIVHVQLAHAAQLFEGLVDVANTQTLTGVIGHAPLFLPLRLHLNRQVLVILFLVLTSWVRGTKEWEGLQAKQSGHTDRERRVPHVKVLKWTNQKLLEVGMSSILSAYWCNLTGSQKFGIIMTFLMFLKEEDSSAHQGCIYLTKKQ